MAAGDSHSASTLSHRDLTGSEPNRSNGDYRRTDESDPETGEVYCKRCGSWVKPEGRGWCPQCRCFLPGNIAALQHGMDARKRDRLPADLRVTVEEFLNNLIADQGGLDELTTVRAALVREAADLEAARNLLMRDVIRLGISTAQGIRSYDRLLATYDRQHRIFGMLGLGRRARKVDPLEVIHRAVEEANQR